MNNERSSMVRTPESALRSQVTELERELAETRRFLHLAQEQQEACNHELEAARAALAGARNPRVLRELSERRQADEADEALRRSEARYRGLADNIPQLVWTCTPDGQCDYLNQQWSDYTGMPLERQMGQEWAEQVHPDDRKRTGDCWRKGVERKEAFDLEYRLKNARGEYRWFQVRSVPLFDSEHNIIKWFGTCTDIEDQKRAKELLEETVAERTAALRETVQELEAFSYSIAHDIRAPLRAMQGFATLLEQECAQLTQPRVHDFSRRIIEATNRMDSLIRDVLNYTKILRGRLTLIPIHLSRLLHSLVESYPNLQPSSAQIDIELGDILVLGNEGVLTQCFANLLGNAVKFVAPGVKPRVRIWAEEKVVSERISESVSEKPGERKAPSLTHSFTDSLTGPRVRVWIEDNGIGIEQALHHRIFEMFQRATTEYEGTGIGLAIVRKGVERMGGRVGVESEPGKGSRFWVELRPAGQ